MLRSSSVFTAALLCFASSPFSAQEADSVEVTPHDVVRPVSQNTGTGVGACQQFMPWAYDFNGVRVRRELTYVWSVSNPADFQIDAVTGVACARLSALPDTVRTVVTATLAGSQTSGSATYTVTPDPAESPPVAGLPHAGEAALDTTLLPPGPAPTNVTVTPISPTALQIAWTGVTGASGYQIYRASSSGGSFAALTRAPVQGNQTTDPTLMPKTTAYYKVSALVPNQREGMSAAVSGTTPPAPNPDSLSATLAADLRSVTLTWPAPTGASGYQLYKGGGLVSTTPLRTTSYTDTAIIRGTTYKYQVAALYSSAKHGEFEADLLTMPTVIVAVRATGTRAVPSHGTTWLTKNNGPGSPEEAGKYYDVIGATANFGTFAKWRAAHGFSARDQVSAVYFNDGDLALGRDMHCREAQGQLACYVSNYGPEPGTPGFPNPEQALAAATARGAPLATVAMERSLQILERVVEVNNPYRDIDTELDIQPDDHLTITASGRTSWGYDLEGPAGKSGSGCDSLHPLRCAPHLALLGRLDGYFLIGSRFFGYAPTGRRAARLFLRINHSQRTPVDASTKMQVTVRIEGYRVKFLVFGPDGMLQRRAVLDSEGPKSVPHVCLSCHGGTYEPATQTVGGASFLPFDVFTFKFAQTNGHRLADQQEAFRKLNAMVKRSRPNGSNAHNPIAALIDGMYGGGVNVAGRTASDSWVPSQWAAKPNVYDAVVKRYCRTCHLALREELDFTSSAQFLAVASRIQNAVCDLRTMPHAEVPFRKLWLSEVPHLPCYLEDPSVLGVKCMSP
jgi:hypothetical protein